MKKKDLVDAIERSRKGKSRTTDKISDDSVETIAYRDIRASFRRRDPRTGRFTEVKPVMPPPKNPTKKGGKSK